MVDHNAVRNRFIVGVTTVGVALASAAGHAGAEDIPPVSPAVFVEEVTGAKAATDTLADWNVGATDLGVIWESEPGRVLMAFGDTFETPGGEGAGVGDWRSNILLGSSDADLSDGMSFDWALVDDTGRATEIVGSLKEPGVEHTTIPTGAVQVDGRQYLAYMSVREWGPPGQWWTNFSQLIYSDDGGATWSDEGAPRWDNYADDSHPFQMVAFVHRGDFVYMFGTPNGRLGAVSLARVPDGDMLDKAAYRYWDGAGWSAEERDAAPIIPPAAAELSVRFDESSGLWQLVTLNGNADLVLRLAEAPYGPWGEEQILATQREYPGLYGGYIHPFSPEGQIYFAMSVWNEYNVALMRVSIDEEGRIIRPNLLRDSSFEMSTTFDVADGWVLQGRGGIDTVSTWANVGKQQFWLRSNEGRHLVTQQVAVQPNTRYRLTGWLTTGDSVGGDAGEGLFGVQTSGPGASVLAEERFGDLDGYTRFVVEFDTGTNALVDVYAGSTMTADRWVQGDDFSLVALTDPVAPSPTPQPSAEPSPGPEPSPQPTPTTSAMPTTPPAETPAPTVTVRPQVPGLPSTGA